MASGHPGDAVRQINRLFRDGTSAGLTDGQLLERFATRRPEAAEGRVRGPGASAWADGLAGLLERCSRDPHDVEDAFQATFLVLVKQGPGPRRAGACSAPGYMAWPIGWP